MKPNFTYKFIYDLNDLSEKTWSHLSSNNIFHTKEFLQTTASTNNHIHHVWMKVEKNEDWVGLLYFQIVPFDGAELKSYKPGANNGFLNLTKQALVDCVLDKINWQLAVLGNIFITGENGQIFHPSITQNERWQIVNHAAQMFFAKLKPDALLITDIYEQTLNGSEVIKKSKFRQFAVEPDMILTLENEWTSFKDYLNSISSKYRVRAKKVLKESKQLTVKQLTDQDCHLYCEELYRLYLNVMDNADFKLAIASKNYFSSIKQEYPNDFHVQAYFLEDKLVGFISYFDQKHQMDVHLLGLDYRFNRDYSIYQRVLYDCVAIGIQNRNRKIHFGRTASIIKSAVGAKPVPVSSFIKHISTLSNIAFKPLTSYLKPEPFTTRNPFK